MTELSCATVLATLTVAARAVSVSADARCTHEFKMIGDRGTLAGSYKPGSYDAHLVEGGATKLQVSVTNLGPRNCSYGDPLRSAQLRAAIRKATAFHICCDQLELLDDKKVLATFTY